MEGLISTFHIDVKIIIAQIVNFTIVFVVLYIFAFKPLGKLMTQRRKEIEKGLDDAKNSETELIVAKQKVEEELRKAQLEVNNIIALANEKGSSIIADAEDKAQNKADEFIAKAKKDIKSEREQMQQDLLEKTADLVTLGISKILNEDVGDNKNASINKRALEILKQF